MNIVPPCTATIKKIQNLEIGLYSRSTLMQSHGLAYSFLIILCI